MLNAAPVPVDAEEGVDAVEDLGTIQIETDLSAAAGNGEATYLVRQDTSAAHRAETALQDAAGFAASLEADLRAVLAAGTQTPDGSTSSSDVCPRNRAHLNLQADALSGFNGQSDRGLAVKSPCFSASGVSDGVLPAITLRNVDGGPLLQFVHYCRTLDVWQWLSPVGSPSGAVSNGPFGATRHDRGQFIR